jgi:hypothetical protein
MQTSALNGRKRPSLSEQIERLDSILDGLADNLNEAVADAVKSAVAAAVKETVQTVLTEVLTNPAVLAGLQAAQPVAPAPAAPAVAGSRVGPRLGQVWSWLWGRARALGHQGIAYLQTVCQGGIRMAKQFSNRVSTVARPLRILSWFWRPLLLAACVGVLLGLAATMAGPWLAALCSGVGGFTTALAVQAGWWLRQVFRLVRAAAPERNETVAPAQC